MGALLLWTYRENIKKNRIRNRTVYYACSEIASQIVEKGEYENLKNVVVTFLLTEASLNSTTDNSVVLLKNDKTGELYSDLLTIHEINIKHINEKNSLELQILRDFFEIDCQEKFDTFVQKYDSTSYGKSLLNHYAAATSDISILDKLSEEVKFTMRLTEEERIEAEEKGLKEGIKEGKLETAKNMLGKGFTIDVISDITGLTKEEIKEIHTNI